MNDRYYHDQYGNHWKEMDGLFGRINIMLPKGFKKKRISNGNPHQTAVAIMAKANCSCCGMSAVEAVADLTNPSRRRR